MAPRPRGFCKFCGGSGITAAHIWDEWLQEVIPAGWDRWESWVVGKDIDDPSVYERKSKQGAVHTKVSRKFCGSCNGGWMGTIGSAAKDAVSKLVTGRSIDLCADQQRAVATWLALSAMLADMQTRSDTKFPETDRKYMFSNRQPPPHWFIFLGQYTGTSFFPFAANNAYFNLRNGDAAGKVIHALQVKTATMGQLYSAVVVHSPRHSPGMSGEILRLHNPWLIPLQPMIAPVIRFPRPAEYCVTGALTLGPAGGLAMKLATGYVKYFENTVKGLPL
jgi:hypothetical protein